MPQLKENDINQIMQEVVDKFLIPKFNELDMNATGRWIESLETEARQNVGIIRGEDYSEYLHRGRGPNKNLSPEAVKAWVGWAGSTFLSDWVKAKGLVINPFAVAQNMARRGWSPPRSYGSDLLTVLESSECIDYVRSRYTGLMRLEVKNSFERMVKEVFV